MNLEKFNSAVSFVRQPPSDTPIPSTNEQKLQMYGLYKQATVGQCGQHGGSQPWAVQIEARAKWDAWNNVQDMCAETAREEYIKVLDSIVPSWA